MKKELQMDDIKIPKQAFYYKPWKEILPIQERD
jgi:hypothetical protein